MRQYLGTVTEWDLDERIQEALGNMDEDEADFDLSILEDYWR